MKEFNILLFALLLFGSCAEKNRLSDDMQSRQEAGLSDSTVAEVIDDNKKGSNYQDEATFLTTSLTNPPGGKVMMQAFYWDTPVGNWWNTLAYQIKNWAKAGIYTIWIPPMYKSTGQNSMGYTPYDYYDLGEFNQKGGTKTRFGSRTELDNLIEIVHKYKMEVLADIVINHNDGGDWERNEYLASIGNPYPESKREYRAQGDSSKTDFTAVASKRFPRTYEQFYPTDVDVTDGENLKARDLNPDNLFGEFGVELAVDRKDVQDSLKVLANFYKKEVGIDGWRFDFVKGLEAWVIKMWIDAANGFSVGEHWSGIDAINSWVDAVNGQGDDFEQRTSAFDFPNFYKMRDAFNKQDLNALRGTGNDVFFRRNPSSAVTFVDNHDIYKEGESINKHKLLAYAYILMHPGYPCLFYLDYVNPDMTKAINKLIETRLRLAVGNENVLDATGMDKTTEYLMRRDGNATIPGLILYLNIKSTEQTQVTATNNWAGKTIYDITGNITTELTVPANGEVELIAPANSYAVWTVKE